MKRLVLVGAVCVVSLAVAGMVTGCGGGTRTVTQTVEVSTTVTEGSSAPGGGAVSAVTKFCSSPEANELEVLDAEVSAAINEGDFGGAPQKAVEAMLPIAEDAPRGSQCVETAFGTAKAWALNNASLLKEIQAVEQAAEETLADVREVEREGNGNGE
jgi:hypothetical protein